MTIYRALACAVFSSTFPTTLSSFNFGQRGRDNPYLWGSTIQSKVLDNDQSLRTPAPSVSANPSQSPTFVPSVSPSLTPSSSPSKKMTEIKLDPMAITLTIQNMTAEEVDKHLMNETPRDALLFSVKEHINWFAINDLTLDYQDSTKQDLKPLFKQFTVSISEMNTLSGRKLRTQNNEVQLETTFFCTADVIDVDENTEMKKFTDTLSSYQVESFKGQPGVSFLTLLKARNDTVLEKAIAVKSEIVPVPVSVPVSDPTTPEIPNIVDPDTPTEEENGLLDKWFGGDRWKKKAVYGGICVGGLIAMATILYMQNLKRKKAATKALNEENETVSSEDFPLREVENNNSGSRESEDGSCYPSDETAVSSMWDTVTQRDDCKYFEYVERMNPKKFTNSSAGKRSTESNLHEASIMQKSRNVSSVIIPEDGENGFSTEGSTDSEDGIEQNEKSHSTPTIETSDTDYASVELNPHDTTHDATTVRGSNSTYPSRENGPMFESCVQQQSKQKSNTPPMQELKNSVRKVFNIWG
jgi:hypothetical protein